MITNEDFRNYCITRRNELRLSCLKVSELAGVSYRVIDNFERGLNKPTFALAVRMSSALKFNLDDVASIYRFSNPGNDPEIPFD